MQRCTRPLSTKLTALLCLGLFLVAGQGVADADDTPSQSDETGNAAGGSGGDSGDSGNTGGNITVNVCFATDCTITVTSGDSGNTGQGGAGGGAATHHTESADDTTEIMPTPLEPTAPAAPTVRELLQHTIEQQWLGMQCDTETTAHPVADLPGECQ